MTNPTHNLLTFAIAGLTFQVESPLDVDALGLRGRFGPFLGDIVGDDPVVRLRWREGDPSAVARGPLVHDPGSIWRAYRRADGRDGHVVEVAYPGHRSTDPTRAAMTVNDTWDDIEVVEQPVGPNWQSLLNIGVGELTLRTRILFADGLVCHASGLDDNGRGLLFVGHAGAGKSTQALLWTAEPGVTALNDDRVAVRLHPDGPVIHGTPWGGTADIACNHQVPLAAILLIEQAPENALLPLSPAAAAPLLAPRTFLPYWDAALMGLALGHLERLLSAAPVYRLRCRPEPSVIPLVRAAL